MLTKMKLCILLISHQIMIGLDPITLLRMHFAKKL